MAMKMKVAVFWVVAPCSDVVEYQRFGGPCHCHLQGEVIGALVAQTTIQTN